MASKLDEIAWPLRTKRLLIRRVVDSDLDATWQFRKLAVVGEWLTTLPTNREEYQKKFDDPERRERTLIVELDGLVIGDLMVGIEDAWSQSEVADRAKGMQAELGWCIDPGHSRQGYATEAVQEMVRLCFEDLGIRRLTANCFADNTASWRLMERLGMRREIYAVQDSLHRSGRWLDGMGYALLADEWRQTATG